MLPNFFFTIKNDHMKKNIPPPFRTLHRILQWCVECSPQFTHLREQRLGGRGGHTLENDDFKTEIGGPR
jgi:hypothetical protein